MQQVIVFHIDCSLGCASGTPCRLCNNYTSKQWQAVKLACQVLLSALLLLARRCLGC